MRKFIKSICILGLSVLLAGSSVLAEEALFMDESVTELKLFDDGGEALPAEGANESEKREDAEDEVLFEGDEEELLTASGKCGEDVSYELRSDGTLRIFGTGDTYDYTFDAPAPWLLGSVRSVTIENGVTGLGSYLFYNCFFLTDVSIADSVTRIGESAFDSCDGLISIVLPDSVTSIGDYAFHYCFKLTSITLSESLDDIGKYAFSYCESLESITLPDSVTSIAEAAFYNCISLVSIELPPSLPGIREDTFAFCHSLSQVTIPYSVSYIESYAFWDCTALERIMIPPTVTCIEFEAFISCEPEITGYPGTEAERFAEEEGLTFISAFGSVDTLSISQTAFGKVKLKWDPVNGAEGYKIQYSASSNFSKATTVNVKSGSTVSKTISLSKSGTLYFRIRAYQTVNSEKVFSGWTKKKTTVLKKPSAVTGYTVKAGSKKIQFSWNALSGVTGYRITISVEASFPNDSSKTKSKNITDTKASISNLKAQTYYTKIEAYSKLGSKTYYGPAVTKSIAVS